MSGLDFADWAAGWRTERDNITLTRGGERPTIGHVNAFTRRPWLAGLLVALPIAVVAGAYAGAVLRPNELFGFDLGPARSVAWAAAAVLASLILAGRMAREDLGTFSGLVAYLALGLGLAVGLGALGNLLLGEFAREGAFVAYILSAILSVGATLPMWLPASVVWVAAVRRLTIPGLTGATEMERAAGEAARAAAAREHVMVDGTNIADQGSRLRRNRT